MAKKTGFEALIERAAAAIEKRRKPMKIYFTALERDLEFVPIGAVDVDTLAESCGDDTELFMKRVIYQSCPELVTIARELMERGVIQTACDVADILHDSDKVEIINALRAFNVPPSEIVIEADEIKNA